MAISRSLIAAFLLSMVLLQFAEPASSHHMIARSGLERHLLQTLDCGAACTARCRLSSRPNLCKRACGTCCARCGCVPPGTSGSQEVCPCYYNETTHGGEKKCP